MSEVEKVSVKSDTGFRNRWGVGNHIYRQDGKKLTVKGTYVLRGLIVIFLFFGAYALLRPLPDKDKEPINYIGVGKTVADVDIPQAITTSEAQRRTKLNAGKAATKFGGLQVVSRPRISEFPPGLLIKAKLITGATNGPVKAVTLEAITVNGEVVAESNSVIVGNGTSTEDRLLIDFSKLVFVDGKTQSIKAQACDAKDLTVGVTGSKVAQRASMLAAGVGLNFAGGLAEGLQETSVSNGVAVKRNDFKNAALNGAARASLEQSKEIIEKWKQQKSVIEVKKDTVICILFSGD